MSGSQSTPLQQVLQKMPGLTEEDRARLSRILHGYLKARLSHCKTLSHTVPQDQRGQLIKVYVVPRVQQEAPSTSPVERQERDLPDVSERYEGEVPPDKEKEPTPSQDPPPPPLPLKEALMPFLRRQFEENGPHWVLLGEAGAGKTTTLQYLAFTCACHAQGRGEDPKFPPEVWVPVFLQLPLMYEAWQQGSRGPEKSLVEEFRRVIPEEVSLEDVELLAQHGIFLVLLDGLDEIPAEHRGGFLQALQDFVTRYPRIRVMLSSRTPAYWGGLQGFQVYDLLPLTDPERIRDFLERWLKVLRPKWNAVDEAQKLWQALQNIPSLRRAATTPLVLRMLAEQWARERSLPQTRGELYRHYVEETLWQRARERGLDWQEEERLRDLCLLERWAWQRQMHGVHEARNLRELLWEEDILREVSEENPTWKEWDTRMREKVGILAAVGESRLFTHLTWQEYFVARHLLRAWKQHPKVVWRFLKPRLLLDNWQEPLVLLLSFLYHGHPGLLAEVGEQKRRETAVEWIQRIYRLQRRDRAVHLLRRYHLLALRLATEIGWIEGTQKFLEDLLSELLKPENQALRDYARDVLRLQPPEALQPYLSEMLGRLKNEDSLLQEATLDVLRSLPPENFQSYLPEILKKLEDKDGGVRRAALEVLKGFPPEVLQTHLSEILKRLEDEDYLVCWTAVEVLDRIPPEDLQPYLLEILKRLEDEDVFVRGVIRRFLRRMPPKVLQPHLSEILKRLEDEDSLVRDAALDVLESFPPEALQPHLSKILERLEDESSSVRWAARRVLGRIPPEALQPYLSKILQRLEDESSSVRWAALAVLERTPSEDLRSYLPKILERLEDKDGGVRRIALEVLGRIPPEALQPHLSEILERLEDEDSLVRWAALEVLRRLSSEDLQPYLSIILKRLEDKDLLVQRAVRRVLERIPPEALQPHLPEILKRLEDHDVIVRQTTLEVFQGLPPETLRPHLPEILKRLEDGDSLVRKSALYVLKGFPPGDLKHHLPKILKRLEDEDSLVRDAALDVLEGLPLEDLRFYLPKIAKRLEDKNVVVRRAALQVLVGILEAETREAAEKQDWDPMAPPLGFWQRLGCIVRRWWKGGWRWMKKELPFVAAVLTILMFFGIYIAFSFHPQALRKPAIVVLVGGLIVFPVALYRAWRKGVCEKAGPEAPQCDQEKAPFQDTKPPS